MGAKYAKNPTHFCRGCHKSFKNKRALKAHNDALHAEKPVPEENRLAVGGDSGDADRRSDSVRDGNAPNLIIIDESSPIDPKWFDKL